MKTFEELKVNLQEQDEPMMRVIMLGGPGSGKSTYSKFITKHFQIPHVYTGDMMRSLAQQDTDIGKKVKSALDKGDYVDTKIVLDTLEARLQRKDTKRGYVLDGFPRSMQQVREMERRNIGYDHVVFLDVAEDEVVRRLTSRGRADDKPDIIKNRIAVYKRETMPVIKHFENKMLNIRVEGGEQIEDVAANIIDRLEAADEDF
tara:strand:+ start:194 stop:802 length:609 start_codon:yes stop_codon:yes gene_type:complete